MTEFSQIEIVDIEPSDEAAGFGGAPIAFEVVGSYNASDPDCPLYGGGVAVNLEPEAVVPVEGRTNNVLMQGGWPVGRFVSARAVMGQVVRVGRWTPNPDIRSDHAPSNIIVESGSGADATAHP